VTDNSLDIGLDGGRRLVEERWLSNRGGDVLGKGEPVIGEVRATAVDMAITVAGARVNSWAAYGGGEIAGQGQPVAGEVRGNGVRYGLSPWRAPGEAGVASRRGEIGARVSPRRRSSRLRRRACLGSRATTSRASVLGEDKAGGGHLVARAGIIDSRGATGEGRFSICSFIGRGSVSGQRSAYVSYLSICKARYIIESATC